VRVVVKVTLDPVATAPGSDTAQADSLRYIR